MKKKLLFSGAGGSLFPFLFESLKENYEIFAMDSNEQIKYLYKNYNILTVPKISDKSFRQHIIDIIKKYEISFYIPLIDEELTKAIDIAKETHIQTLTPSKDFIKLCLNKYELMKTLMNKNISYIPTVYANNYNENFEYPIFLKPNIGRGSRGIRKIHTNEEFKAYFILENYKTNEVLVQPFIRGEEYTVSVTVNNKNKLISIIPKKIYIKDGITKHAKSIYNKDIEKVCNLIVDKLLPYGSFNVQLKIYKNKIYIFEINPRFSTTLVLSIASGINEIDLCIKNFDLDNVNYISNFKEINLYRRWENVFYK